ncbi:hypothetical protein M8J76_009463 [Diaphorina citri]|nr:hypothetical protein M8J76_009463 [Diaphorina citri]
MHQKLDVVRHQKSEDSKGELSFLTSHRSYLRNQKGRDENTTLVKGRERKKRQENEINEKEEAAKMKKLRKKGKGRRLPADLLTEKYGWKLWQG